MTAKTKWITGSALVLIALLMIVIFSKNIWNWFENVLVQILIYLIVFGAGWLSGRFSGRRPKREEKAANTEPEQR